MSLKINFSEDTKKSKTLVYLVDDKKTFSKKLKAQDKKLGGILTDAVKAAKFEGKANSFISSYTTKGDRVIIAGLGKAKQDNAEKALREAGGNIAKTLEAHKIAEAAIIVDGIILGFKEADAAANIAYGAHLRAYNFNKYFSKKKDDKQAKLKEINIVTSSTKNTKKAFTPLQGVAESVYVARNYVSEPPNTLYPENYAKFIKDDFKSLGIKVEVLDEKKMEKLGMNSLLCVGQGSEKASRLVVMKYEGAKNKKDKPVAFVGKGVTFDSGGISLKPGDGMWDMKYDMGGSAAAVGAIRAVAARKAKVNAVCVVGLVENMPDGKSVKPADIVTSMSGQTIEVLNTDAEGRLVLADALWYTQKEFNPKIIIDLATLTGACVVALGQHKAGLLSNDDKLAEQIYNAGEEVGERVWRLPLGDEYDKQMDSKIADMQNISNMKGGGTITAGQFLQRFVNDKTWAHLDIAGVAWAEKAKPMTPQGATGFGVQLLDRLVAKYYEK